MNEINTSAPPVQKRSTFYLQAMNYDAFPVTYDIARFDLEIPITKTDFVAGVRRVTEDLLNEMRLNKCIEIEDILVEIAVELHASFELIQLIGSVELTEDDIFEEY